MFGRISSLVRSPSARRGCHAMQCILRPISTGFEPALCFMLAAGPCPISRDLNTSGEQGDYKVVPAPADAGVFLS